jgi:hypothetical protein
MIRHKVHSTWIFVYAKWRILAYVKFIENMYYLYVNYVVVRLVLDRRWYV